MATQLKQQMTVEAFDAWVEQLADDANYEYIAGEVVEVVSNNYSSQIAARILTFIGMYLINHSIGYVTGADGGYRVKGERYIPDVAFISKTRQSKPSHATYNPLAPDLAVEVVSPTDTEKLMLVKLSNYLASGTTVWIVYPTEKEVHIHRPGEGAAVLNVEHSLPGDDILPGFSLPVQDIFPPDEE